MRNQRLKAGEEPLFSTDETTAIRLFFYRYAGVKETDLAAEVRSRLPGAVVGEADDRHDVDGAAVETMIDVDVTGMDNPTMFLGLDQLFTRLADYHPQVEMLPAHRTTPHSSIATGPTANQPAATGDDAGPTGPMGQGQADGEEKAMGPEPASDDADGTAPAPEQTADRKHGAPDCPRRGRRKAARSTRTATDGDAAPKRRRSVRKPKPSVDEQAGK